jgi:hypothetical protein
MAAIKAGRGRRVKDGLSGRFAPVARIGYAPGGSIPIAVTVPFRTMAITYRIDFERRIVVAAAAGTLAEDQILAYQREVWTRADVAGFDELIDMSAVESIEGPVPIADRIRDLAGAAAANDPLKGRSKFAIVAPGDLAFGLGRMYATFRELDSRTTRTVRVFRVMDDALRWLGLDALDLPSGDDS